MNILFLACSLFQHNDLNGSELRLQGLKIRVVREQRREKVCKSLQVLDCLCASSVTHSRG